VIRKRLVLDAADLWLQKHDPYYRDGNKWKGRDLDYTYLTAKQQRYRNSKEIPFSNTFALHKLVEAGIGDVFIEWDA
jgi:hypothetical protein